MDDFRSGNIEAVYALMNASMDQCMLLDQDGYIQVLNKSAAGFFGKTQQEVEGTLCWEHLPREQALVRKERMEGVLRTGKPETFVDLVGDRIFEVYCKPIPEVAGQVEFIANFISDITVQVKAEQELIASEARHRRLFNENPVPMYVYDTRTLQILDANKALIKSYGYTRDELLSMTVRDIRPAEDVEKVMESVTDLRSKQVYLGLWRHTKKDGSIIDVDIASGDFPCEERPARLVLCNDVTENVEALKALEKREEEYRYLFEHNPLPMMIFDPATLEFLNVNSAAVLHYGFEKEEFLGMTIRDIRPPEDIDLAVKTIRSMKSPVERPGVYRHMKKDGTVILVDISSNEINYEGKKARLTLCNDVTDQVQARKALEASEIKFRKAFLTSPDPMTISRLEDGVLLEVNGGFVKGTGYSREESLGKTTFDLELWTYDSQRDEMVGALQREGWLENFELTVKIKDGSFRHVLLSASIIRIGNVPRMFTVTRDITDLKLAEDALLQSQEQLRASLKEKEILLREIHHRVKNNLQVISGLLDLQAHHIGDPTGREIYKESQNRVITMALIHEELYKSINLSQVDFADYIGNLSKNLMVSYGVDRKRIKLNIDAQKTEMVVDTAIPCGLIINELITNSLKHAFPGKRKGTISLTFKHMRNKNYVFTVSDDGIGIPGDVDLNSTTSLGMQLVTVMVAQLGGTLKIRRREGASFEIKFKEYHEAGSVMY